MIMLSGIPSEPPLKMVIDAAKRTAIPYIVFNQRSAHLYDLSIHCCRGKFECILQIDGKEYNLEELSGLYLRMMDYHLLPELSSNIFNYVGESQAEKSAMLQHKFLQWIEIATCRILNRPSDMLSNLSKPYQSQLIAGAGFYVPPTCITTSPDEVLKFKNRYERVIFKSISSVRSIVQELGSNYQKDLPRVRNAPTQFQQKLKGFNIRVHVVGDVLFATRIASKVVDYRYSSREGEETILEPFQLPLYVENRCFELAKSLNLPLCGIDLFLEENGGYYCFEVNPSPGYSYYQQSTGQDIASAIVKWLHFGTAK